MNEQDHIFVAWLTDRGLMDFYGKLWRPGCRGRFRGWLELAIVDYLATLRVPDRKRFEMCVCEYRTKIFHFIEISRKKRKEVSSMATIPKEDSELTWNKDARAYMKKDFRRILRGDCPSCGAKGSLVVDAMLVISCVNCPASWSDKKALAHSRKMKKTEWIGEIDLFRKKRR